MNGKYTSIIALFIVLSFILGGCGTVSSSPVGPVSGAHSQEVVSQTEKPAVDEKAPTATPEGSAGAAADIEYNTNEFTPGSLSGPVIMPRLPEGVPGEPIFIDTGDYNNDGNGYNEVIDGAVVPSIRDSGIELNLSVAHTNSLTTMAWGYGADLYYGSLQMHYLSPDAGYPIKDEMEDSYKYRTVDKKVSDILVDSMDEDLYVLGNYDGNATDLYYGVIVNDYLIECHVSSYEKVTYNDCMAYIARMFEIAGLG